MAFGKGGSWGVGRSWRSGAGQPNPFTPCPQLEVNLEEIPGEGLLVSWAFTDSPDLRLTVLPKLQTKEVRGQAWEKRDSTGRGRRGWRFHLCVLLFSLQRGEEQVELSTIQELIEDAIVSTQPAMMINLRACSASGSLVSRQLKQMICARSVPRVLCQDSCSFYLLLLVGAQ